MCVYVFVLCTEFHLPASRPNFAELTRTTQKVDRPCLDTAFKNKVAVSGVTPGFYKTDPIRSVQPYLRSLKIAVPSSIHTVNLHLFNF